MGAERERQALAGGRRSQAASGIYAAAEGPHGQAARLCPTPMRRGPASADGLAGRLQRRRRAGPTSRIATATVGVGRDLSPDTGTGGELYAVIGHGAAAARPQHRRRRPGHRRHRQAELAAPRDRGAGLLQGQGAVRADRQRSASRATCRRRERPVIRIYGHAAAQLRAVSARRAPTGTTISTSARPAASTCATSSVPVRKKA